MALIRSQAFPDKLAKIPCRRVHRLGSFACAIVCFVIVGTLIAPVDLWSQQAAGASIAAREDNPLEDLPEAPSIQAPAPNIKPLPPDQIPSSPTLSSDIPTATHAEIENEAPGIIRGVVTDHEGAVYQGVTVTLTQPSAIKLPQRLATTDSDGRFEFLVVPPGAFTLTVTSEGFQTQVVTGMLRSGEAYEGAAIVLPFARNSTEIMVTASRQEIAQAQIKQEEKQRVLGIVPNFYVSYAPNAQPLTKRQKFDLAWKSTIDPITIFSSAAVAGYEQGTNDFRGYGQGTEGYFKRFGANYADDAIATLIGGAILPSLLKQDPRYFYKGTGTIRSRALYAIANAVICKGDNGRWQVNYSAIVGGLAAAGISNIYYPASDRNGASLTFENTLIGTGGTAAGNLFQEFLVKKLTPHLPKYSTLHP